jgi:sugar phosphate isomerase/epimerase
MKKSISNIAWSPEERIQAYEMMSEFGVLGLEIAPSLFFHTAQDPFAPDATTARLAVSEMRKEGLGLVSMQSLLFGVTGAELFGDGEAWLAFEKGMTRAIDLAHRFEIPNLVFGSPTQRRVPDGKSMELAKSEAVEKFHRLGEKAATAGTAITVEPNAEAYGTNFLNTIEEASAFVEQVQHPAIRSILDLGAMHMNQSFDQTVQVIPRIIPHLNHVHVSEPNLAPAPKRAQDLAQVLRGLQKAGYDKSVSIEMKRTQDGLKSVRAAITRFTSAFGELSLA